MTTTKYGGCVVINGVPIAMSDEEVERLATDGKIVDRTLAEALIARQEDCDALDRAIAIIERAASLDLITAGDVAGTLREVRATHCLASP